MSTTANKRAQDKVLTAAKEKIEKLLKETEDREGVCELTNTLCKLLLVEMKAAGDGEGDWGSELDRQIER